MWWCHERLCMAEGCVGSTVHMKQRRLQHGSNYMTLIWWKSEENKESRGPFIAVFLYKKKYIINPDVYINFTKPWNLDFCWLLWSCKVSLISKSLNPFSLNAFEVAVSTCIPMFMIHRFVFYSSQTVMSNDDFTSVQTQPRAHTRAHNDWGVTWCRWKWKVVTETRKMIWLVLRQRLQILLEMPWLLPEFTPSMGPPAPHMDASIDDCQRERPGGEHYPGRSGTLRWPRERPLETLQRATSVQTRPISSCRASSQSGAVKPETAAKCAVKFQLKFPSRVRLNLLWLCWAFLSSFVCHSFNSAAERLASMSPSTFFFFFFDHMTNGFLHTCMGVAHSGTPTLRGIMQRSLEFTQRSKNTHAGGNPPIPQQRSRTTKTPEQ